MDDYVYRNRDDIQHQHHRLTREDAFNFFDHPREMKCPDCKELYCRWLSNGVEDAIKCTCCGALIVVKRRDDYGSCKDSYHV